MKRTKKRTTVSKQLAEITEYVDGRLESLSPKLRRRAEVLLGYLDRAERVAIEIQQSTSL